MNNSDVLNFIESPEFKDFIENYTFNLPVTIGLISKVFKILMQKNINIINVTKELKTYMESKKNIIMESDNPSYKAYEEIREFLVGKILENITFQCIRCNKDTVMGYKCCGSYSGLL